MGLCRRVLIRLRCGIRALLSWAARRYSFSRVRPGVSSTAFILSLVSIGLSIVAFTLDCLVVLTLGAAGCCSCGGFTVASNVTRLLCSGADVGLAGILFRISSSRCSASISSMPFLFRLSFSASVRSFSAFTIVSSGVKVGSVIYLCLKCTVSDILSLRVFLQ